MRASFELPHSALGWAGMLCWVAGLMVEHGHCHLSPCGWTDAGSGGVNVNRSLSCSAQLALSALLNPPDDNSLMATVATGASSWAYIHSYTETGKGGCRKGMCDSCIAIAVYACVCCVSVGCVCTEKGQHSSFLNYFFYR